MTLTSTFAAKTNLAVSSMEFCSRLLDEGDMNVGKAGAGNSYSLNTLAIVYDFSKSEN
jgi:hypothetical protein